MWAICAAPSSHFMPATGLYEVIVFAVLCQFCVVLTLGIDTLTSFSSKFNIFNGFLNFITTCSIVLIIVQVMHTKSVKRLKAKR